MTRLHSLTAVALTGLVGLTTLSAPLAASAREEGRWNSNSAPNVAYVRNQRDNEVQARNRREPAGYAYDGRARFGNDGDRDHGNIEETAFRFRQPIRIDVRDHGDRDRHDNGCNHWRGDR